MIMKLEFESLNPEWYSEEQFGNYCLYVEVVDGMVVAERPKFGDRYTDVEPYPFRPTWGTELMIERINNCLTMGDLDNLRMEIACELESRSFEDIKKIQKAFISRKNKIKRNGGKISWN